MALAFTIAASVAFLAIAIVATMRRGRTPLAVHLALMSVALFAYTALDALAVISDNARFDWLSYTFAALLAIPTFNLAIGFVGMSKPLRGYRYALAAYFVALALATLSPFVKPSWHAFPAGELWSALMLAGLAPAVIGAGVLLYRHASKSPPEERARTRLLVWSLLLGVGGNIIDLVLLALDSSIRLSALPLALSSLLVAALILRAKILEDVTTLTLFTAAVIAVLAVVGQVAVYAYSGTRIAMLAFGTLVVFLAVFAASRPLFTAFSEQRARVQYLATLGRFSEQMAHDVRNPLAAILGAAQFLQEEHRQGRSLEKHAEFLDMIVERVERLERVISDYQRMGRVELRPESVDLNALVEAVSAGMQAGSDDAVRVDLELAPNRPVVSADHDLLTVALENLVRNAFEAMPEGGEVVISTERHADALLLTVRDSGIGMDARRREQAFDDFFSSKDVGSGLGLPFVARIAEAHGGRVTLDSQPGVGTSVAIELPCSG